MTKALKEIFEDTIDEKELNDVIFNDAELINELDPKTQIRRYYIKKNNSLIFLDKIEENNTRNKENKVKKRNTLEKFSKLPNFLEALFKMKLSNYDEPLLLSGPTCYKTFATKMILKNKDVISLNQFHNY